MTTAIFCYDDRPYLILLSLHMSTCTIQSVHAGRNTTALQLTATYDSCHIAVHAKDCNTLPYFSPAPLCDALVDLHATPIYRACIAIAHCLSRELLSRSSSMCPIPTFRSFNISRLNIPSPRAPHLLLNTLPLRPPPLILLTPNHLMHL